MIEPVDVYILLGANLDNSIQNIEFATHSISTDIGDIKCKSALYKTEPWGMESQPWFYNQVLHILTKMPPTDLLQALQQIEKTLGKDKKEKWGAREIDIDILFYGNQVIKQEGLIIPHAYIAKRNFTLVPLNEIAPGFIHPVLNMTMHELLENSTDTLKVEKANLHVL
jgi:2-amino-4-hydroxy-6-hydroxymethyldihydropteridine diphosphokinase